MRNILGHCPSKHRAEVALAAKRVFQATDMINLKNLVGGVQLA